MKAMIFAAGLGTRLRPLTDNCPKALIELNGRPMLERVIMRLKDAGVTEMVINIHYLGRMIRDFLEVNDNFGITIHVSDESQLLLDTGGAVLKAREWLDGDEPFFIHNADIFTDLNLRAMADEHIATGADATLLVADRSTSRYLLFDDTMRLHGWTNKKTGQVIPSTINPDDYTWLAFGGVHIFSPMLFPLLESWSHQFADAAVGSACGVPPFSIIPFYVNAAAEANIRGYAPTGYNWVDIGSPETLAKARSLA